jgi:hypothetical protein
MSPLDHQKSTPATSRDKDPALSPTVLRRSVLPMVTQHNANVTFPLYITERADVPFEDTGLDLIFRRHDRRFEAHLGGKLLSKLKHAVVLSAFGQYTPWKWIAVVIAGVKTNKNVLLGHKASGIDK